MFYPSDSKVAKKMALEKRPAEKEDNEILPQQLLFVFSFNPVVNLFVCVCICQCMCVCVCMNIRADALTHIGMYKGHRLPLKCLSSSFSC